MWHVLSDVAAQRFSEFISVYIHRRKYIYIYIDSCIHTCLYSFLIYDKKKNVSLAKHDQVDTVDSSQKTV